MVCGNEWQRDQDEWTKACSPNNTSERQVGSKIMRKPIKRGVPRWGLSRKKTDESLDSGGEGGLRSLNLIRKFTGIADSKGKVQFASEAPVKGLGYTDDDVLRKPFWEAGWFAQSAESQKAVRDAVLEALEGETVRCEVEAFAKDGTAIPVTFAMSPLKGKGGGILNIVAEAESIAEARDEELRESDERLASVLDLIEDAYFELDDKDRFVVISPSGANFLGYELPNELIGERMSRFWANPEHRNEFLKELSKRGRVEGCEASLVRNDGIEVMVEADVHLLYDERGEVRGSEGIFRDITERNTYERKLEEAYARSEEAREEVEAEVSKRVAQLRELEKRNAALIEQATDGIVVIQDGVFKLANAEVLRLTGYTAEELDGRKYTDILTAESAELSWQRYEQRMSGDSVPGIYEIEVVRKDGEILPLEISAGLVDYKGKPADMIILRNIIERRRAENSRLEAERRYRAIFDNQLHMVYVHDERGRFIDVNDFALERLGYSKDEVGGISLQEVVWTEDIPIALQAVASARGKGYMEGPVEIRLVSKLGEVIWVEVLDVITEDNGDNFIGMGIAREITERKQYEQQLAKAAKILETMTDGIVVTNMQGVMVDANRAWTEQTGYERDEVTGRAISEIVSASGNREAFLGRLGELAEGNNLDAEADEYIITRKDGTEFSASIGFSVLNSPSGEPVGVVAVCRDISERKLAEDALKGSEERLRDLVNKLKLSQEELSTPVVQIWDGVLALPLIGIIDGTRAQRIMEVLLSRIVETQSELVIMDVTGVASMDSDVTNHLIKAIHSTALLGARCIVTGISPEISQVMACLEVVDVSHLVTMRDMQEGLKYGLEKMGYEVKVKSQP